MVVANLLAVSAVVFEAALLTGTAALSLSEVIRVAVGAVDEALVGDSSMGASTRLRVRVGGGAGITTLAEVLPVALATVGLVVAGTVVA